MRTHQVGEVDVGPLAIHLHVQLIPLEHLRHGVLPEHLLQHLNHTLLRIIQCLLNWDLQLLGIRLVLQQELQKGD
jgi:hypothetical protein